MARRKKRVRFCALEIKEFPAFELVQIQRPHSKEKMRVARFELATFRCQRIVTVIALRLLTHTYESNAITRLSYTRVVVHDSSAIFKCFAFQALSTQRKKQDENIHLLFLQCAAIFCAYAFMSFSFQVLSGQEASLSFLNRGMM
jgi:hypothetical protein